MWRNSDKSWTVNLSTGTGFAMQRWTGAWGSDGPIHVGDLNGDGKTDVFMWRQSDNSWTVNLSNGNGFMMQRWIGGCENSKSYIVNDFNGDNKSDVAIWNDGTKQWVINLSLGNGFAMQTWTGAWGSDGPIRTGDFNGDGRKDIIMWRGSDNSWTINLSKKTEIGLASTVSDCFEGVRKMKTDVGWGGRALSVSVDPTNENIIWVASPTGGLFKSTDGGASWSHIDAFPQSGCFAVSVCQTDPNTIIATAIENTKAKSEGGIWVSKDAGNSWRQPYSAVPKASNGHPKRFNAYGICYRYNTQTVYVGSDSGFAVSNDLGLTWQFINPQVNKSKNSIYSIITAGNKVLTYGSEGIWMSDNGTTNWYRDNTGLATGWKIPNAFGTSPVNRNHLFFGCNYGSLYYSLNDGVDWTPITVDFGDYDASRQIYVKAIRPPGGNENAVDLYYAQKSAVGKKSITWDGSNYNFSSAWEKLAFNHSDPADMAIAKSNPMTVYAVNDGGIEKSIDGGKTWTKKGMATSGYDAFQVYDVKSVLDQNSPSSNHIYFGTQDVNIYSSGDNGISWPDEGVVVPEGGNIQSPHTKSGGDYSVNYYSVPNYQYANSLLSKRNYSTIIPSSNNKIYYAKENTFFSFSNDADGNLGLLVSSDGGATWPTQAVVTLTQILGIHPSISGPADNPSIIVPFTAAGNTGLIRIDNAFNGTDSDESVTSIPLPSGANLGNYGTQWIGSITSYAVDPTDPNYIIINDVGNNEIYISNNGGQTWVDRPDLKNLITKNGEYIFSISDNNRMNFELMTSQVSAITFHPLDKEIILIGTAESGIICSRDHGNKWFRIAKSESIPNITSFAFLQNDEAIASSWGRGLWKVSLKNETEIIPYSLTKFIGRDTIPGNRRKAHDMYTDVTSPTLLIRDQDSQKINHYVIAGSQSLILGRRWLENSEKEYPLIFVLDGKEIKLKILDFTGGAFSVQLPIFQEPSYHELRVIQRKKPEGRIESTIRFNVIPIDKE